MKSFRLFTEAKEPEDDGKDFKSTTGKFGDITLTVECGRGHTTEFDKSTAIKHNRYRGMYIMWECEECPGRNNHFIANLPKAAK